MRKQAGVSALGNKFAVDHKKGADMVGLESRAQIAAEFDFVGFSGQKDFGANGGGMQF